MTLTAYLRDKTLLLLWGTGFLLFLYFFLRVTGYPQDDCILLLILILLAAVISMMVDFGRKRKYFQEIYRQLEQLDKPYLIGEVMESSPRLTDQLYRQIIRVSNRSVVETVHELEQDKKEYQEYVEGWIHEVKAPLTAMNLMCARKLAEDEVNAVFFRKLLLELESTENAVEQALFFARSDEVYRDYIIKETKLLDTVSEAIAGNRRFLTACRMKIEVSVTGECTVYSDGKWLVFMLSQILRNCGQYRKQEQGAGRIAISAAEKDKLVILSIEDDGIGIAEDELPRIFEKGFTGANGRKRKKSTGMGLYLCRKLCARLGMSIGAESEEGKGTRIWLEIPREKGIHIYEDMAVLSDAGRTDGDRSVCPEI